MTWTPGRARAIDQRTVSACCLYTEGQLLPVGASEAPRETACNLNSPRKDSDVLCGTCQLQTPIRLWPSCFSPEKPLGWHWCPKLLPSHTRLTVVMILSSTFSLPFLLSALPPPSHVPALPSLSPPPSPLPLYLYLSLPLSLPSLEA